MELPAPRPSGHRMAEKTRYRGYLIVLEAFGTGWRAFIYAPGAALALEDVPNTSSPAGRTALMDEAKGIVDRLLRLN